MKDTMTDIQLFTDMLDAAGIGYDRQGGMVELRAKTDDKVSGYTGCSVEFFFMADGSLDSVAVWE